MRTNNCQSAEQQQSATTQRLPVKQRCVVKLHREDEGVVLRIQLVIDDESINRTSCASLYHKCPRRSRGFASQMRRGFGSARKGVVRHISFFLVKGCRAARALEELVAH
jgi:hypothetical protein